MKKIYYCIVEEIEVDENMTEEEIDQMIFEKAFEKEQKPKDYMWSEKRNLLE